MTKGWQRHFVRAKQITALQQPISPFSLYTSGVTGPERVDSVSVAVDRWLAEHGVALESHMSARARQAGFKQKEEIEDLQLATLEVLSRRLRNQARGVHSSFVFDGRISFEG